MRSALFACLLALGFAPSAYAADYAPYGDGPRAKCIAEAHKVISQREATKYLARHYAKNRPFDLKQHGDWAENLFSEQVIMPEEYRARLIRQRVRACN